MSNPSNIATPLPSLWDYSPIRAYLGAMNRRHGVVDSLALPNMRDLPAMRLDKLFVYPQLSTTPVSATTPEEQWPQGLNLFSTLETAPQLVVLGDPGAGKTTLSNWLAWRLSAGLVGKLPDALENKLPIPCVLRELQFNASTTLADLVVLVAKRLLGECDASLQEHLQAWVAAKRYVLILDGVDEVSHGLRQVIGGWMKQAKEDGAVVVATSRLVGYEDAPVDCPTSEMAEGDLADGEFEADPALAMAEGKSRRRMWERDPASIWAELRYLMPFDNNRIAAFISNWYLQRSGSEQEAAQKAGDLQTALKKSGAMQELARTPNLLSLMAIVHRERAHLPEGKALLYKEISNAYINTIDQQRKISPGDALVPYGWEAREGWLAYVGFKMQCERSAAKRGDKEAGVLVSEAKVVEWLSEAMQASGVPSAALNAAEFLAWVARRSGLLLPRGEGVYAFVHLSFQEYFCACYLLRRVTSRAFIRDSLPDDAPVTKQLLTLWSKVPLWHESLVFLLELLSSGGDSEAVEEMAEILLDGMGQTDDFGINKAELAAHVLQDRHIHLTMEWQQSLARRCSLSAMQSAEVLAGMAKTGYATIIHNNILINKMGFQTSTSFVNLATVFVVVIMGAALPDKKSLASFNNLKALKLANTKIEEISSLVSLRNLRGLDLHRTLVKDISALAALSNLQFLDLQGTQVQDISVLARLSNLQVLNLQGTQVADISALARLSKLRALNLRGTQVKDISTLGGLRNLQLLFIPKTPKLVTEALKAALPNLKIQDY